MGVMKLNFHTVQCLRGLGAMLVLVFHVMIMLRDRLGIHVPMFIAGGAGILFFIISGFIMVVATRDGWGESGQARKFMERRLIRVVPLYWLMTTIKLAILVRGGHESLSSWHTIASYLFIPSFNDKQEILPVLIPGWTLIFEMFFYVCFAAILFLRKPPIMHLTIILVPLAILGAVFQPFTFAPFRLFDPLLLEFVLGMWIAAYAGQWNISRGLAFALLLIFIGALVVTNPLPLSFTDTHRFILWGLPAALLLVAALSVEEMRLWRAPVLLAVGDASYAIYLTHDFAISAVRVVMEKLQLAGGITVIASILLSVIVACIGGYAVYRIIEKPLTHWLRVKLHALKYA